MTTTRINATSAIAVVSISAMIAHAGGVTSWTNGAGGFWNDLNNWDTASVPGQSDDVIIGLGGAFTVSVNSTESAASLSITNPMATLGINNARQLNVFGDMSNEGLVIINQEASISATLLDFEDSGILSGSGTLRLNSSGARAQLRTGASGVTLTNNGAHTIDGFGQVSADLINNATVRANVSGQELQLLGNDKTNNAIMEATGGGILDLGVLTLTQGAAGQLRATGGSRVDLNSTTVVGGSLSSDAGSTIEILSGTFDGVSVSGGTINLQNARTLNVFNSMTNNGTIVVNSEGSISSTQIHFRTSGAFDGSGDVIMNSVGARARLVSDPGTTMTNTPSHTIRGLGQIEASLINNGLVQADVGGQELFFLSNDKVNNAIIEAIDGGILDFGSITLSNASGQVIADGAGTRIDLNSTSIDGGDILALNGGVVEVNTASLTGAYLEGLMNVRNARTLTVTDSITNNGMIVVNTEGSISGTQIVFANDGAFLGNGSVNLNSDGTRARIQGAAGVTVTNPSTHTIFGRGQIDADLVNNGLIRADVPGTELFLATNDKVNNATIRAQGGGSLDFSSITIENGSGQIIADGMDSRIDLNSTTINGGDILALNGGVVEVNTASLTGAYFEGLMNVRNSRTLTVTDSITNNGMIVVNTEGSISGTQIVFANDGAFMGNGSVNLNSDGIRARIQSAADVTVTNPSTHTIFGRGQIDADLVNNGLIRADVPATELFLATNDKVNNGTIRAENTAALDFRNITVQQGGAGQIIADGAGTRIDLNSTTLSGGALMATNGGRVDVATATLDNVVCDAPIEVINAFTLSIRGGVENNNLIIVNREGSISATQLSWLDDSELGGNGTVRLNSSGVRARLAISGDATMATLGEGQRLEGIGSIDAPLMQFGTTAPGLSIGTMSASQPITMAGSSVFEAEVDGGAADLLDSSSTIELGGTLQIVYTDGFAPSGFWSRKVMEGSDITNKFETILVPAPGAGFVTRVYNSGTELFVGQTCPSDTNLDGVLNFFDVSVFLNNYNIGSLDADLNDDGVLNFFDVSTFLNSYNLGC
ncbi:MAG: GC-type dockerin domain-anchored protein [Phycisphaerales bacterium]